MRNKILILGSSGYVGRYLVEYFDSKNINFNYTHSQNQYKNSSKYDILIDSLSNLIDLTIVKTCVLLLGDTKPDSCFLNKEHTDLVNVKKTIELIDLLNKHSIRIIFASTEFVYDGVSHFYNENDLVNPILYYGIQKHSVEKYIINNVKSYCILRFAKVYSCNYDNSFLSKFFTDIQSNNKVIVADDQFFSAVDVMDIAKSIEILCHDEENQIFNCGGPIGLSRYDYLMLLLTNLRVYKNVKYDDNLILPIKINSLNFPELRPLNVSMNSTSLYKKISYIFNDPFYIIDNFVYNKFNSYG